MANPKTWDPDRQARWLVETIEAGLAVLTKDELTAMVGTLLQSMMVDAVEGRLVLRPKLSVVKTPEVG